MEAGATGQDDAVESLGSRDLLARRVISSLSRRADVAGMCGAAVVSVYLVFVSQGSDALKSGHDQTSFVVATVYLVAVVLANWPVRRRLFRPVRTWLESSDAPTPAQVRAVLAQPRRQVLVLLANWLGAIVLFASLSEFAYHDSGQRIGRIVVAIVLGAATCTGLSFLLIERTMRPVFALVLPHTPPEAITAVSVRGRFFLAWTLGSGVALAGIALAPIGRGPDGHQLAVTTVFLALIGLVAGAVFTASAARSVAEPLADVRNKLRQVRAGHLDVAVTVDAPGEVGLLQAGFNEMVAGLQQREQLRDLFGRHVGEEVARRALEQGVRLGGEVRDASALFVDLAGSTRLAFTRPPQEVLAILNDFFQAVVEVAAAEGGWVNKFEGDAALCVFGAPVDQSDHAARALRAARALHHRLVELSDRYPDLDAGVGVSSGQLVAGNVGSEERYEYTVIGDPVNEAARLTDLAKGLVERVATSASAIERAGGEARHWQRHDTAVLRGRDAETVIFVPDDYRQADRQTVGVEQAP
jgi:adenylate cyclase